MYSQYGNNNICDLDAITVHDIDFDIGSSNACYGQFTYGDYLQELQELEQGRTPMKIDRQSITRDISNLHWVHNVGLPVDQQPTRQPTISLMVDPNTNMPVQFSTNRTNIQTMTPQSIAYMTIPQSLPQQHQAQTLYQRAEMHQQNLMHHQKYVHEKGKENGTPGQKVFPKPVFSYSCLIAMALRNSDHGSLPVSEIYKYMQSRFPYFKTAPDGWKNSVRHNLSLNKAFCKLERPDGTSQRKGCLWSLKPEKKDQLRREIRKWKKKHPEAIKASMANPDELSLSSDSLDDDSMDDTKTPSPEHTVPESTMPEPAPTPTPIPMEEMKVDIKEEPIDEVAVENAAKELFGNDLLFNQDDLHAEEFWNDLIDSSENSQLIGLHDQNKFLTDDLVEVESSIKLEGSSPATNFFSSAVHPPTLAGF
ncbi:forkhead box protein N4-like isoform X2 [Hydractinia symbiolongicarpus]|uniref:forkhead box protein N4-like isoform X2 n=1 Tax=Hydractinia symbiolongicarpus TaxID=13093 RepID=UPI00254B2CE1|nr:forkhead box protein N4-like isoform X2 [Hydractinia symbiolongicarpus]